MVTSGLRETNEYARGWTANAINPRARQASEIDRLGAQVAMLQEQTRIKDARMGARAGVNLAQPGSSG